MTVLLCKFYLQIYYFLLPDGNMKKDSLSVLVFAVFIRSFFYNQFIYDVTSLNAPPITAWQFMKTNIYMYV